MQRLGSGKCKTPCSSKAFPHPMRRGASSATFRLASYPYPFSGACPVNSSMQAAMISSRKAPGPTALAVTTAPTSINRRRMALARSDATAMPPSAADKRWINFSVPAMNSSEYAPWKRPHRYRHPRPGSRGPDAQGGASTNTLRHRIAAATPLCSSRLSKRSAISSKAARMAAQKSKDCELLAVRHLLKLLPLTQTPAALGHRS